MLKRITLKSLVFASFVLMLAMIGFTSFQGLTASSSINDAMSDTIEGPATRVRMAARTERDTYRIPSQMKSIMLARDRAVMDQIKADFDQTRLDLRERVAEVRAVTRPENLREVDQFEADLDIYLNSMNDAVAFALLNSNTRARALSNDVSRPLFRDLNELIVASIVAENKSSSVALGDTRNSDYLAELMIPLARLAVLEAEYIGATSTDRMDSIAVVINDAKGAVTQKLEQLRANDYDPSQLSAIEAALSDYANSVADVMATSRENGNQKASDIINGVGADQLARVVESLAGMIKTLKQHGRGGGGH